MRVALAAHECGKNGKVDWSVRHTLVLSRHTLSATGTAGKRIGEQQSGAIFATNCTASNLLIAAIERDMDLKGH